MVPQTRLSKEDFREYLEQHATRRNSKSNFWVVDKPMKVFKTIYTYSSRCDKGIRYNPHESEDQTKRRFSRQFNSLVHTDSAIANLIIPVGTVIHISLKEFDRKFRAEKAIVHSIVRTHDKQPVVYGISGHDFTFVYLNGQMLGKKVEVTPTNGYRHYAGTCESGIHFHIQSNGFTIF